MHRFSDIYNWSSADNSFHLVSSLILPAITMYMYVTVDPFLIGGIDHQLHCVLKIIVQISKTLLFAPGSSFAELQGMGRELPRLHIPDERDSGCVGAVHSDDCQG